MEVSMELTVKSEWDNAIFLGEWRQMFACGIATDRTVSPF